MKRLARLIVVVVGLSVLAPVLPRAAEAESPTWTSSTMVEPSPFPWRRCRHTCCTGTDFQAASRRTVNPNTHMNSTDGDYFISSGLLAVPRSSAS